VSELEPELDPELVLSTPLPGVPLVSLDVGAPGLEGSTVVGAGAGGVRVTLLGGGLGVTRVGGL
jgi:hypothetical protein